jgi:lipid-binding SYLF domain-containing protein
MCPPHSPTRTTKNSISAPPARPLSWSRAKGIFGGVSLAGSTLRSDDGANQNLYGKKLDAKDIVRAGQVSIPADGKPLIDLLQMTSPKHTG